MRDHTYQGKPVSQMRTEDLKQLLEEGFAILEGDGLPPAVIERSVRSRLEIELLIRQKGLRG